MSSRQLTQNVELCRSDNVDAKTHLYTTFTHKTTTGAGHKKLFSGLTINLISSKTIHVDIL